MARAKVKLNRAGMRELLKSDGVRDELTRRMGPVLAAAKASAPVKSGAHRNSLHIVQATTDRVVVRVVADSDHSLAVEATTGHMARALDQAAGA